MADDKIKPGGSYYLNVDNNGVNYQVQFDGVAGGLKVSFDDSVVKVYSINSLNGRSREIPLRSMSDFDITAVRSALQKETLQNSSGVKLTPAEMVKASAAFERQLTTAQPLAKTEKTPR